MARKYNICYTAFAQHDPALKRRIAWRYATAQYAYAQSRRTKIQQNPARLRTQKRAAANAARELRVKTKSAQLFSVDAIHRFVYFGASMSELLGFHTCKQDNGEDYVLANAPFPSRYSDKHPERDPFLGEGRYLWYNDLNQAHWWGECRLKCPYYVLEIGVPYAEGDFYDLCEPDNQQLFGTVVRKLEEFGHLAIDEPIGKILEFIRILARDDPNWNIKLFTVVRGEERKHGGRYPRNFRRVSPGRSFFELAPVFVLCVYEEYDLALLRKRMVGNNISR